MPEIVATRTMQQPRSAVWSVLADFPNIADWSEGITSSTGTSANPNGLGATRACTIGSATLNERILSWTPESEMVVLIHDTKKLPVKESTTTFTLSEDGPDATTVTFAADVTFKFGPLGVLLAKLASGRIKAGNEGILRELEAEAARRGTS